MKYKNKQGISLNYTGTDSHQVLVREVIMVAIKMLDEYNWNVQFEDNFTDVVSMNIDRDSELLTFYVGDRQIGQF